MKPHASRLPTGFHVTADRYGEAEDGAGLCPLLGTFWAPATHPAEGEQSLKS